MVPRKPEDDRDHAGELATDSEENESESDTSASESEDVTAENLDSMEQEYHTEESDEDGSNENNESQDGDSEPVAPLLPLELLKPLPSPAYSVPHPTNIPWEEMTRQQRVAARNRSRKAKKRVWDRLKRDSQSTGVVEAGKDAQVRRGLQAQDKAKSGRIEKRPSAKTPVSGRQRLLEDRKRAIDQKESKLMAPPKSRKRRRVPR